MMLPQIASLNVNEVPIGGNSKPGVLTKCIDKDKSKPYKVLHQTLDRLWYASNSQLPPEGFDAYPNLLALWNVSGQNGENPFRYPGTINEGSKGYRRAGWRALEGKNAKLNKAINGIDTVYGEAHKEFKQYKKTVMKGQPEVMLQVKAVETVATTATVASVYTEDKIAKALLRFWFNKDGRKWHEKKILTPLGFNYDNPEENKYADISPDLHKKRVEWATEIVQSMDKELDFTKLIPMPPLVYHGTKLWVQGYDDIPSELVESCRSDCDVAMPLMYGPTVSIDEKGGKNDGVHVLCLVKELEGIALKKGKQADGWLAANAPVDAFSIFKTLVISMKKTEEALVNSHEDFMITLKIMGVKVLEKLHITENYLHNYTDSSTAYNSPLRYSANAWKKLTDAVDSKAEKDVLTRAIKESVLSIRHEHSHHWVTENTLCSSLEQVHGLWKIMAMSPRAPVDLVVFRSEASPSNLPHTLAGNSNPTPGDMYILPSFTSTSIAFPTKYWAKKSPLSSFYDIGSDCCMYIIHVKKGTPILPAYMQGNSKYPDEKEIVLPPLMQLTYLGKQKVNIGNRQPLVHSYIAISMLT